MHEDFLQALSARFGDQAVLTLPQDRAPFERDWRGRSAAEALAVLRPSTPADVEAMVRLCHQHKFAIVPQGGNTGLCGGSVPTPSLPRPQVILSLAKLNHIRAVDPINNTITADAGVPLAEIHAAATAVERLFPLSLASEGSCQIGGNIATNAGGIHVLRYGSMRQLVLGLEVVMAHGQTWHGLRGLRKDNTGYDLKHCFIGSEGTLGIITAATLRLFPKPAHQTTVWVGINTPEDALALFHAMQARCPELSAFELMGARALALCTDHFPQTRRPTEIAHPWHVLMTIDLSEERVIDALETLPLLDCLIAKSEPQAKALWTLRENLSEAQRLEGPSLKHDIALPLSEIPRFLREADALIETSLPGTRIVCFGHLGDGNLHFNLFPPGHFDSVDALERGPGQVLTPAILALVQRFAGSFSAEHGIGQFKVSQLEDKRPALELALMRQLKAAWDPQDLLNPGKIFRAPKSSLPS